MESSVVGLIIAAILHALGVPENQELPYRNLGEFIIAAILLAPIIETLLFQCVPVGVIRSINGGPSAQLVATTLVFFIPHLTGGLVAGIAGGLVGGLYLGYTYIFWRAHGFRKALCITILAHTLHNGIVGLIIAAAGGF